MQMALRVAVGVAGFLGLFVAVRIWMAPEEVAFQLGVLPEGTFGIATIRADLGGFFAAAGALSLFGAIKGRAGVLTAPLVMIGLALAGRLISLAVTGVTNEMLPPLAIELALVLILALGRFRMVS